MDAQATSTDGTESNTHHVASLVRQCNTCYQHSNNFQNPSRDSTTGSGLAKIQPQVKVNPSLGSTTRLSEQGKIRRQIMPHKYNQQLLDCVHTGPWKTPTSALHTPNFNTTDNASYKQGTTITERCNNEHITKRKETEPSTTKRSANKAEENSRANITNGYITNTSEATITASTTA